MSRPRNNNNDGRYRWTTLLNKKTRQLHRVIAEKVLGRPLLKGEEVHHVDENKANNLNSNLLICDHGFQQLIHARLRAYKVCGNPNYRFCTYCKQYDDPENMSFYSNGIYCHLACKRENYQQLNKPKS